MASLAKRVDRVPFAPVVGLLFAVAVATLVAAMPQWRFEQLAETSGLGDWLSVARPPLGLKARILAMLAAGGLVGLGLWLVIRTIERLAKPELVQIPDSDPERAAQTRRLFTTNGKRKPIFAELELGAPLMSDEALASAAVSAAEDAANEEEPAGELLLDEPVGKMPPVDPVLAEPITIEEFDLPLAAEEPGQREGETSIDALIRRLEAGLARRRGPNPPASPPSAEPPLILSRDWMVVQPGSTGNSNDDDDGSTASALDTLRRMAGG